MSRPRGGGDRYGLAEKVPDRDEFDVVEILVLKFIAHSL